MSSPLNRCARAALLLALPSLAACGGHSLAGALGGAQAFSNIPAPGGPNATVGLGIGPSKIKHVVIMIQENRSFDYIFGGLDNNGNPFPGADSVSNPFPGEPTPKNHLGQPVTIQTGVLEDCYVPNHDRPNAVTEINKKPYFMDGFDKDVVQALSCAPSKGKIPTDYVYKTVNYNEVVPYWQMGKQYAISDRMFESSTSASFAAHLYYIAGQSSRSIDNPGGSPWGCDEQYVKNKQGQMVQPDVPVYNEKTGGEVPLIVPCFSIPTLADEMDAKGVSWRYYGMPVSDFGYNWISYDAIRQIRYGSDWTNNVVTPTSQIFTDITNGNLASVTWVTPSLANSDHPLSTSNTGPAWVASVVDAIGNSQFWDSTAIFVAWDDWGGWYDHVQPPVLNVVEYGLRVPLIVVSPYAKNGYVSHTTHSASSLLRFTEEVFDLPSLGQLDARSDDLGDMFNFTQPPTQFQNFALGGIPMSEVLRNASQSRALPKGATPDD